MPATAIIDQSAARRGSGTRRSRMIGRKTAIAIASRTAAKLTGGRSRNPILMNSQTLLQIRHVTHQRTIVTVYLSFGIRHLPFAICHLALTLRGRRLPRRRAACIQVVPIQHRVEAEEEVPLRLPAPVGAVGEHHDVSLADRRIHRDRAAGQRFPADEDARQQHVVGIRWEREQHARRRGISTATCASASTKATAAACSTSTAAATTASSAGLFSRSRWCIERREPRRHAVWLHVVVAGTTLAPGTATSAATSTTAADREDRRLVEVHRQRVLVVAVED